MGAKDGKHARALASLGRGFSRAAPLHEDNIVTTLSMWIE
jgi:hypothetical protein